MRLHKTLPEHPTAALTNAKLLMPAEDDTRMDEEPDEAERPDGGESPIALAAAGQLLEIQHLNERAQS